MVMGSRGSARGDGANRFRRVWLVPATVVLVVALAGCAGIGMGSGPATASPTASTPPATVEVSPSGQQVRPDAVVQVTVHDGGIQSVVVTSIGDDGDEGDEVDGKVDRSGSIWNSSGVLAPGTTYRVVTTVVDGSGASSEQTETFRTLTPEVTASAQVTPGSDWTVGVGMPVVVDFSRAVTQREAVQEALSVAAKPAVNGAWRWMSATQIQWRPAKYWEPGTKVTVTSDLSSVELAEGVWGRSARDITFRIGDAMVSTVDVAGHTMTVRRNGSEIATIPVTTGRPGLDTRNGIKVIMSRQAKVRMDAATTGIPTTDPDYYDLDVYWAMRLTHSGEFLHAAPWSIESHGHANTSHGCTGMSDKWAQWLYEKSKVGDVVIYTGSPRSLEWGNGYTAWNMDYATWKSGGSA